MLIEGELVRGLISAVFLGLSFVYFLRDDRRVTLLHILFALAALLGAIGYVFGFFEEVASYDELVHAYMTFSVSLAFLFLFYGGAVPRRRAVATATSVFTLGVTVGALWEVFEWVVGIGGGLPDTISDMVVDSGGALAAALVALVLRWRGDRLT